MPRYASYGSYGAVFGAFDQKAIVIETAQSIRQRPLLVSATMALPAGVVPTAEQKAGYARVLVYIGQLSADIGTALFQASTYDWGFLSVDRILLDHVFPINSGFTLVLPTLDSSLYRSQENQAVGALLVRPCDQVGVAMDGWGTLTFYATSESDSDTPRYKVI